jgi:hypothetical protein
MSDWQDMMVGDRMTVDGEFAPRVEESRFSRQEWGLIMTATTFEIDHPEDEQEAELVANTDDLRGMMPELEKVGNMGPMGNQQADSGDSEGVFGSVLDALGMGSGGSGGVDEKKLQAAEDLVAEYADELQTHLETEGRWEKIRKAAADN